MDKARTIFQAAVVFLALSTSAHAGEDVVTQEQIQAAIDIAFGATLTSNYVSRGSTQTEDKPAIQGYVEASYGIAYAGVWASNVSFDGTKDTELDVYAGIRPEIGDFSFDLGYAHYIYGEDPTVYGEIYGKAYYAFSDAVTLGTEHYFDPHNNTNWSNINVEFSGLPGELVASGSVGTNFGRNSDKTKYAWDVGVSRSFANDTFTLDLRYHDSNLDSARIVGSVSFDLSLASLGSN